MNIGKPVYILCVLFCFCIIFNGYLYSYIVCKLGNTLINKVIKRNDACNVIWKKIAFVVMEFDSLNC